MNTSHDNAYIAYTQQRESFWDSLGRTDKPLSAMQRFYHDYVARMYSFVIPEGQRILELGCGTGRLLAALRPAYGVGMDFAQSMVEVAQNKYHSLHFIKGDIHDKNCFNLIDQEKIPFDYIVLSDIINDVWDLYTVFENIKSVCAPHTRIVCNFHSHLWEHPFQVMQKIGNVTPHLPQNWFTCEDVGNVAYLAGFECVTNKNFMLWPWSTPIVEPLCNRWLAKIWPFNMFDLSHLMVLRLQATSKEYSVSVIIPARNEAGNIEAALQRTPDMGVHTEIIFVEGNSTDNTWGTIQEMASKYSHRSIKTLQQSGKGKGDAVRVGFEAASNDILMILDADLTMPPESLPQFYDAISSGKAEFVNGVRLVYPQEKEAMRFCNLVANKFFGIAFSWLLGTSIKDTLCGTKVIFRKDYVQLAKNRLYFGDFDPFGDFDLIFGAAKMQLKIHDLPVRYRDRVYGETNISRWRDGVTLLKMVLFAAKRIKFV